VTNDFDILGPLVSRAAEEYTEPHPTRKINIVKSPLGGRQVLIGAACAALGL
jgi:hypothetical protein